MEGTHKARIESIDLLRGVVIILMALDHVRMYFGEGGWYAEPTDLATTTPPLFLTRWITHFCAPVFIFLGGTSASLYGAHRHSTGEVSRYVLTRGLFLVFLELVIVNFGWTFDITFSYRLLQVIWAIGVSMVVLAALVYLPKWAIFAFGIVLVLGHNLLDPIQMVGASAQAFLSQSLADFGFPLYVVYLVWILVMVIMYPLSKWYRAYKKRHPEQRLLRYI